MTDAYILDHVRTPRGRGKPDGALHGITPIQLLTQVLTRCEIATSSIPRWSRT
jgi:acetyl-CoA C-acetyltransferase